MVTIDPVILDLLLQLSLTIQTPGVPTLSQKYSDTRMTLNELHSSLIQVAPACKISKRMSRALTSGQKKVAAILLG